MWRTTPACVETWKLTSSPLPTTSSVDPPPTSMTTVGVVSPGARSLVAPRKVRRASSSPEITRAWRASSCARTRARKASPLAASRTALVSTATARSAPPASMTARYSASVASTRSIAASSRTPVRSRRSPSRVTLVRRSSSISLPSRATSATSRRVEFVPMSTTATRMCAALTPAARGRASACRRAPRGGCRRRGRPSPRGPSWWPSRCGGRPAGSAPPAAGGRRAAARGR